jgi:hypothetical protein
LPIENIRHLVVLMLENRSFDNMLGFAYDQQNKPAKRIPDDDRIFFGLDFDETGQKPGGDYWNPSNADFFDTSAANPVKVQITAAPHGDFRSPKPDPGEHFDRITAQIFGPGTSRAIEANNQMKGFLLDYAESAGSGGASGIMRYYTPSHVPVITALARNFAVCDPAGSRRVRLRPYRIDPLCIPAPLAAKLITGPTIRWISMFRRFSTCSIICRVRLGMRASRGKCTKIRICACSIDILRPACNFLTYGCSPACKRPTSGIWTTFTRTLNRELSLLRVLSNPG